MCPWSLGLSLGLWVSLLVVLCCLRGFVWICVSVFNVRLSVLVPWLVQIDVSFPGYVDEGGCNGAWVNLRAPSLVV